MRRRLRTNFPSNNPIPPVRRVRRQQPRPPRRFRRVNTQAYRGDMQRQIEEANRPFYDIDRRGPPVSPNTARAFRDMFDLPPPIHDVTADIESQLANFRLGGRRRRYR
jgi:hypothetical protein